MMRAVHSAEALATGPPTGLALPGLLGEPLPIRAIEPSPCTQACPAGVDVKAYVSLIAEERFADALGVVRESCPLPGVCGRVCTHPCEAACRRSEVDEPLAIRSLKRFVADLESEVPFPEPEVPVFREKKVAVVGSGPAGLTAAYDLRLAGYAVTVLEAEEEPGGMLRHGIAAYRLPYDVLRREIDALLSTGIELRTGVQVGRDLELEELRTEYGAVLLAVGLQVGRRLGLPGEEGCEGVGDALTFLREVNDGARPQPGGRVIVIGGGNTAVEAARTARRLGAEDVRVLYRRTRAEMPADEDEVRAAETEGVRVELLVAPVRALVAHGVLFALECRRMELGEPDESGRRRPLPVGGSEFVVEADRVLAAVGQRLDGDFLPGRLATEVERDGRLVVESASGATPVAGVFAAGDATGGAATVVHAIGSGHRAARSIRRYLESGAAVGELEADVAAPELQVGEPVVQPAARRRPELAHVLTDTTFPEVEQAFERAEAVAEARRCLRCGPCSECLGCVPTCPHRHAEILFPGGREPLQVRTSLALAEVLHADRAVAGTLVPASGEVPTGAPVELRPTRNRIVEERCRGCFLCAEVCPFDAVRREGGVDGEEPRAGIEPLACRGCALCSAVCPTGASVPRPSSTERWGAGAAPGEGCVVLTCGDDRALLPLRAVQDGRPLELHRVSCVGRVDEGTLLELYRRSGRVVVAGCPRGRCRFGEGASLAEARVGRAGALVGLLGGEPERIVYLPHGARPAQRARPLPAEPEREIERLQSVQEESRASIR